MKPHAPEPKPVPDLVQWFESDALCTARWHSEQGAAAPKRFELVDDTITADAAFRLASEGTGLIWKGDFQNAKQLVQALARRLDSRYKKPSKQGPKPFPEAFHQHRVAQLQRSRTLGSVLIVLEADGTVPLRRAPDVSEAVLAAYGERSERWMISLRELLAVIGAHEWEKKGVPIPALEASIYPGYGVFSPIRGEYLDLVAQAPLPAALEQASVAWDVGTGTGVIAALLAKRGIGRIVATDTDERALRCAHRTIQTMGLTAQVTVLNADLFPAGDEQAALIVCNPPWLPGKPSSSLEAAIYDPDHGMLRAFLSQVGSHLLPAGQVWLIMSDLAEHLGLRAPGLLPDLFEKAGLTVIHHLEIKPRHGKVQDKTDPLFKARQAETTSLWILGHST